MKPSSASPSGPILCSTRRCAKSTLITLIALMAVSQGVLSACSTVKGAAVGAGAGAAIGAGTGQGAGRGALIGTGIGAAAGAIYDITH